MKTHFTLMLCVSLLLIFAFVSRAQSISDFKAAFKELRPKKEKETLLLGIKTSDTLPYKTIVIGYDGKNVETKTELPYLAVPDKIGFNYFQRATGMSTWEDEAETPYGIEDTISRITTTFQSTSLVFANKNLDSLLASIQKFIQPYYADSTSTDEETDYRDITDTNIKYATSCCVTIGTSEGSFGRNGTYISYNLNTYDANDLYSTAKLFRQFSTAEWEKIRRTMFFMGAVGQIGYDNYFDLPKSFRLSDYDGHEIADFDSAQYILNVDDPQYELFHERGLVSFYIEALDNGKRSRYEESPGLKLSGFILGKPFADSNDFPLSYERLQTFIPDLGDVFISPGRNLAFLLLQLPNNHFLLRGIKISTGEIVFEQWLDERPIMAEWAMGKRAIDWLSVLRHK